MPTRTGGEAWEKWGKQGQLALRAVRLAVHAELQALRYHGKHRALLDTTISIRKKGHQELVWIIEKFKQESETLLQLLQHLSLILAAALDNNPDHGPQLTDDTKERSSNWQGRAGQEVCFLYIKK